MKEKSIERYDFDITGLIIEEDFWGDGDVPRGLHKIPAYVEEITVRNGKHDITELLTEEALQKFREELLDA